MFWARLKHADVDDDKFYDTVGSDPALAAVLTKIKSPGGQAQWQEFLFSVANAVDCRGFAVTTSRLMCLTLLGSREGDVVCILFGASTPFLLRRVEEKGQGMYQLVGECYVLGLCRGFSRQR